MIENRLNGHLPPITAYDAIQNVPKCDIAWEFLRHCHVAEQKRRVLRIVA